MASETSQNINEQEIVEMMRSLVLIVDGLSERSLNFFLGPASMIIYQNMSDTWNFLNDSVFAVRFSLLVAS